MFMNVKVNATGIGTSAADVTLEQSSTNDGDTNSRARMLLSFMRSEIHSIYSDMQIGKGISQIFVCSHFKMYSIFFH